MPRKHDAKKGTFEARMRRLEEIVESLEGGERPLDEVVAIFEEGIRLSTECLEYLDQAELKLKKLSRDAAGKFQNLTEHDDGS